MVFLVEDFVNLPSDQIANIWLAAHMKRKLNKKDIKKTKLGEACSQLHSDKVKKPMQLRHYGQCLIGISWIHYKQVEYLHNDCNEAFSKARLVLIRKRNVDLDPSKDRAQNQNINIVNTNNNLEIMDIDLNANNLSQLYLNDDNISEIGSLFETAASRSLLGDNHNHNHHANLALDHEITMQQNELISPRLQDRRSSFGNISSLLMGDMDIEIKFDDDDIEQHINDDILDESQAHRDNIEENIASLTDIDDDNVSVERGRGNETGSVSLMMNNGGNISIANDVVSVFDDADSAVSLQKEKQANLDDMSVHSGSINMNMHAMDIDDNDQQSMHSIHVQFDLDDMSVPGSVSTAIINTRGIQALEQREETTPDAKKTQKKVQQKEKKGGKKHKKKKKRFLCDKTIELGRDELRVADIERADFVYPGGRDAIHIWREFPLSTLGFDELLFQPLSKQLFGKFPTEIKQKFEFCNGDKPALDSGGVQVDELANAAILREELDEVEQGRDMDHDGHGHDDDLALPMNDFVNEQIETDAVSVGSVEALLELKNADNEALFDDNASTLESVCNDAIPAPKDPLFDENIADNVENIQPLDDNISIGGDEDEDIDMNMEVEVDSNHLSFETDDALTQTNQQSDGIKPRDWSRRTRKTFSFFKGKEGKEFSFNELMESQTKRETVAGVFYELLVFKNSDLVDLQQDEPYGDITISKTSNFYRHATLSQRLSQRLTQ